MAAGYTSSTARGGLFNQVGGTSSLTDINFLRDQHGDFSVAGDIIVTGEVDGRDVATDGVELDALVAAYGGGVATATTLNVTNINAYDTTASATIASATGVFTINSAVLTTADINGGTIDGSIVGGTTPLAGTFTTLTSTGNVVVAGTVDGRDVATDGTKLDTIEAGATADQTAAEIRAAIEAATDSNVFTDADHAKLNAIEALADVTDVANVTAAGALMDSELTDIASVKALNQGVSTTDSPSFVNGTFTSVITANLATISSTGDLAVADGGTGGSTALAARINLDVDQAGEALALAIALG